MKRTNSSGNLPPTPVNASLSDFDATSYKTRAKKTLAPYLPADVRLRARALATETTHRSEGAKLEMRAPGVYVPEEERPHFFKLPDDVFTQIIPRLNQKAVVSMAASCRLGYFHVDRQAPMRRLPGLLGDLKRLRVGNLSIDPDSFKAFLEAIASGGDYDRALLTPLSPALRCAVTVATQTWGGNRLLARDRIKLNTLISEFLKTNYDQNFDCGVKQVLEWHLKHEENRICSVAAHWANFFANPNVSLETRSRTFEILIDFLFVPKTKLFRPDCLLRIARVNLLTLNFLTTGMLALIDPSSTYFLKQIDQKLAELKESDAKHEMLFLIDFSIRKTEFLGSTRQCEVFLQILDATAKFPEKDTEMVLLKLIAKLEQFRLNGIGSLELLDNVFSDFLASNQNLRKEFDEKATPALIVLPSIGILLHSLVDRIAKLQNAELALSLQRKISDVMLKSDIFLPQFAEYMQRKIVGMH